MKSAFQKLERGRLHRLNAVQLHTSWVKEFKKSPAFSLSRNELGEGIAEYVISEIHADITDLQLVTEDALSNYRASLDHLAFGIASKHFKNDFDDRQVTFGKMKSEKDFKTSFLFKNLLVHEMHCTIEALVALQPWRGGNALLYGLDALNNISKHRHTLEFCFKAHTPTLVLDWVEDFYVELPIGALTAKNAKLSLGETVLRANGTFADGLVGKLLKYAIPEFHFLHHQDLPTEIGADHFLETLEKVENSVSNALSSIIQSLPESF